MPHVRLTVVELAVRSGDKLGRSKDASVPGADVAYDWGVDLAVDRFTRGKLPAGEDMVLGLDDDYAVGLSDTNWQVPSAAVSKMVLRCSAIRQRLPSNMRELNN